MFECEENELKNASHRLLTFDSWPIAFISKESLSDAGFYYLQKDDLVKCAYCKLILCDWHKGDDPMRDHRRWAPCCPFVRALRRLQRKRSANDQCDVYAIDVRPHSRAQKGK